ncbi:MAG TPA: GGDEF domain-containing protein [Terracidiphilus sp.]
MFEFCRRWALVIALVVACLFAAAGLRAQPPAPLKSLSAIHVLSNVQAAQSIPVAFEGSVTYYEKGNVDLFVQDGKDAIYIESASDLNLKSGDRVRVEGFTRASFRPEIAARRVTFLHHGTPPSPVNASFTQLIQAELDCRRVKVRAVVRAANIISDGTGKSLLLDLLMPGGYLQAQVANGGASTDLRELLDSDVEVVGAAAGRFDSKSEMTGIILEVHDFSDLHVLKPPQIGPHNLPIRRFDEILQASQVQDKTQRVRVQGIITYYQPGSAIVFQDGSNALWVDTLTEAPHRVGDQATASGFPDVRNGSVVLTRAEIQSSAASSLLHSAQVDAGQLASGSHAFELVSVEGQLITRVREAAQDQYVLVSHGHVFSAIYRHPERGLDLPVSPMLNLRIGSRVRVTGICVLDRGDQFRGPVAFHLLLRSSSDVAFVAGPSLISVRNLGFLLGFLLIVIFAAVGRSLLLERKLHRQSVATAISVERWRNRVIDGINNAIPLNETLLQITELLSFKLQAEYSWAEVEFEGTFGNYPSASERSKLQVAEKIIPARSGVALGKLCVGFPAATRTRIAPDAFDDAIRLAALAIETGGKYSDLVRRSEFDPLTGVHNRFAFERSLDLAIEQGNTSGTVFGLIYIDLDGFKQVNDDFGHNIGDRYLQEVGSRLHHQLRPEDILARIGGDEFAVVVVNLDSPEEAFEVASRLQSCFNSPFSLDKHEIAGSASMGIAVFPHDAIGREAILECSDARMYEAKRQKRRGPVRFPASA